MTKESKLIKAANFRDFDWNKAKLFYHVAKCGSFTKAARLAGTDRTALTRQIQMLEKQMGSALLTRKAGYGSVILTRKGEELLEKVAPFFLQMKGFCGNPYLEIAGEKRRKIRIATTYALADYVINDLIIEYNKSNPHLVFEIIGEDNAIDFIMNDIDIAIHPIDFRIDGTKTRNSHYHYDYAFGFEKRLFASEEYLKRFGEPQTVEELKNHYLISMTNPDQHPYADVNWILRLGRSNGELNKPAYTSNSLECRVKACEKGIGIIGSYIEFSLIKMANLINILPNVKCARLKNYFIYPSFLKEDEEIIKIRNYLQSNTPQD